MPQVVIAPPMPGGGVLVAVGYGVFAIALIVTMIWLTRKGH